MIELIDWPTPACQKPNQGQEVLVEDRQGRIRVCKYCELDMGDIVTEFWFLQEPRQHVVEPGDVVRWLPVERDSGLWNTSQDCSSPSSFGSDSMAPLSEAEFYDLYQLHQNEVIGGLE